MKCHHVKEIPQTDVSITTSPIYTNSKCILTLPNCGSNDFVIGACFLSAVFAAFPLMPQFAVLMNIRELMSLEDSMGTTLWWLVLIASICYSFGSLLFVRAFTLPPIPPLLPRISFLCTDELFGSWCCLVACLPAIPYFFVIAVSHPTNVVHWILFFAAIVFVVASGVFVFTCSPQYQAMKIEKSIVLNCLERIQGHAASDWLRRHLQTDWLAACWFFLIASCISFAGSLGSFVSQQLLAINLIDVFGAVSVYFLICSANRAELLVWSSSSVDCIFFVMSAAYFVAGSYQADPRSSNTNDIHPITSPLTATTIPELQQQLDSFELNQVYPTRQPSPSIGLNDSIILLASARNNLLHPAFVRGEPRMPTTLVFDDEDEHLAESTKSLQIIK